MTKIMFVGESNPYGGDPFFALYPLPARAAGARLCTILHLRRGHYLRCYERANLLSGEKWSIGVAREAASVLLRASGSRRLVLLGARVSAAFGIPYLPFNARPVPSHPKVIALVLPHPSGRCRTWNDPKARSLARRVFRGFSLRRKGSH